MKIKFLAFKRSDYYWHVIPDPEEIPCPTCIDTFTTDQQVEIMKQYLTEKTQ